MEIVLRWSETTLRLVTVFVIVKVKLLITYHTSQRTYNQKWHSHEKVRVLPLSFDLEWATLQEERKSDVEHRYTLGCLDQYIAPKSKSTGAEWPQPPLKCRRVKMCCQALQTNTNSIMKELRWIKDGVCSYSGGCVSTLVDKPDIMKFGLLSYFSSWRSNQPQKNMDHNLGVLRFLVQI